MKITLGEVKNLVGSFAIVFPVPKIDDVDRFMGIWFYVLKDFESKDVNDACGRLFKKLKCFPYPSHVVDELTAAGVVPDTSDANVAASKPAE